MLRSSVFTKIDLNPVVDPQGIVLASPLTNHPKFWDYTIATPQSSQITSWSHIMGCPLQKQKKRGFACVVWLSLQTRRGRAVSCVHGTEEQTRQYLDHRALDHREGHDGAWQVTVCVISQHGLNPSWESWQILLMGLQYWDSTFNHWVLGSK